MILYQKHSPLIIHCTNLDRMVSPRLISLLPLIIRMSLRGITPNDHSYPACPTLPAYSCPSSPHRLRHPTSSPSGLDNPGGLNLVAPSKMPSISNLQNKISALCSISNSCILKVISGSSGGSYGSSIKVKCFNSPLSLGIPLLQLIHRHVQEDFVKGYPLILVPLPYRIPITAVETDQSHQCNDSALGEEGGDLSRASDGFGAIGFGEG